MFQRLNEYLSPHPLFLPDDASPLRRRVALTLGIWRITKLLQKLANLEAWAWEVICIPYRWTKGIWRSLESRIVSTAAVWGKAHVPGMDIKNSFSVLNSCEGWHRERPQFKHLGQPPVEEPNHETH